MDLRALVRAIIRQTVAYGGTDHLSTQALIADAIDQVRGEQRHQGGTLREAALRILSEPTLLARVRTGDRDVEPSVTKLGPAISQTVDVHDPVSCAWPGVPRRTSTVSDQDNSGPTGRSLAGRRDPDARRAQAEQP